MSIKWKADTRAIVNGRSLPSQGVGIVQVIGRSEYNYPYHYEITMLTIEFKTSPWRGNPPYVWKYHSAVNQYGKPHLEIVISRHVTIKTRKQFFPRGGLFVFLSIKFHLYPK